MSGEIEAFGELATGGLIARAFGVRSRSSRSEAAHADELHDCQNCGAVLRGPFCHACGQSGHVHRTLSHVVEEFAHGVFHVESKGWRTLPMLVVNPGRLTREYIHGKRARYIAPLALFLFMIFLTFFTFGITGASVASVDGIGTEDARAEAINDVRDAQRELADAAKDEDTTAAERAALSAALSTAQAKLAQVQAKTAKTDGVLRDGKGRVIPIQRANWADSIRDANARGEIHVNTGSAAFDARVHHALQDPEFAAYKVQEKAAKLTFLLVPMSLPILWLLFVGRRGINLYDHTVFALYSLSFMSLLAVVLMLSSAAPAWAKPFGGLVILIPPAHMFAQLKGAYRLTTGGALWRTAVLSVASLSILGLFFALMLLIGLID